MTFSTCVRCFFFSLVLLVSLTGTAQLTLSELFTNHMVMQRDQPAVIWGWSKPGAKVTGTFEKETVKTKAGKDGRWKLMFKPRPAGGPHLIIVSDAKEKVVLSDIYMGDVWICSGQSNMEWTVENVSVSEDPIIQQADDTMIRHFKVSRSISEMPDEMIEGGPWEVTSPQTVGQFTAVGYHFARHLRSSEGIPIGLLNTSWGGSRIEPWMSKEALEKLGEPCNAQEILNTMRQRAVEQEKELKRMFPYLSENDAGFEGSIPIWAAGDLVLDDWVEINPSKLWEANGFENIDGIGWYRTQFNLTPEQVNEGITLHLGKIDDSDITWVNGVKVGSMEMKYATNRIYQVPPEALKTGQNSLTVRCEDTGGGGGMYGDRDSLYFQSGDIIQKLSNDWFFKLGAVKAYSNTLPVNQVPTLLYNKMIHPILDFPIKGVIWYQGESNANTREDALNYALLFREMIRDWRARWNIGPFPFLFVQLANFMDTDELPAESNWAILRESQTKALSLEHTGQAVIIDIGEADDIHPKNKLDVGFRLGLAADKIAYGKELVYSGPVYQDHATERNMVFLSFYHIGPGLVNKSAGEHVGGFAIAGKDKKFKWANAVIVGDQVMVWHNEIEHPKQLRYAWGNNPENASLYNGSGLPACPFRVDIK